MSPDDVITLSTYGVRSLSWDGDELVDWPGGGFRFGLDGTAKSNRFNIAYLFDAAVMSPSREFAT